MRAGLWKHWQAAVIGRYALLVLCALAAIVFTRWWLFILAGLLLIMLIARGVAALWRHRDIYPASILRNSLRLLLICPLLALIDGATILGVGWWLWRDLLFRRSPHPKLSS